MAARKLRVLRRLTLSAESSADPLLRLQSSSASLSPSLRPAARLSLQASRVPALILVQPPELFSDSEIAPPVAPPSRSRRPSEVFLRARSAL